MPTGYTAGIANGATFKEFALECARAFGALIMMRDEPPGAPIPERFEPNQLYLENLKSALARLSTLIGMTPEEAEIKAKEYFEKQVAVYDKAIEEKNVLRAKYEAMLDQVVTWQCDPLLINLKDFMAKQIRESIVFDCDTSYYLENIPKELDGIEWLQGEIDRELRNITYYSTENEKEIKRAGERNQWIKALRVSLG